MPLEDIPSMLQQIEAKIASSEINLHHRDTLIRLRHILEEDLRSAGDRQLSEERSRQARHSSPKVQVAGSASTLDN